MIIEYQKGDLVAMLQTAIDSDLEFHMAQGCNCLIRQGSGIAGQLRKFPQIFAADVAFGGEGDRNKLGDFSVACIGNSVVYNLYSQFVPGTDRRHADYAAIAVAFCELNKLNIDRLYIPRIGAGLAGGDWDIIKEIINDATPNLDIVVIDYDQNYNLRNFEHE